MPQQPVKSRRLSHNATEQRRRTKIREKIDELHDIVPTCDSDRKAAILQKTVEYIKYLSHQYDDLFAKSKKLQEEYLKLGGQQDFLSPHLSNPATQSAHMISMGPKDPSVDPSKGVNKSVGGQMLNLSSMPPMGGSVSMIPHSEDHVKMVEKEEKYVNKANPDLPCVDY